MRTHLKASCVTSAIVLALGACLHAGVARASVESVYQPRDGDYNCTAPQESGAALWRPSQGRFVLGGSGTLRVEVYGHGIDLSPSADITGISGASARRIEGRGGAVNGAHYCGNIGSVIVELILPEVSAANQGTLKIGSESIPFTATPRVAQNVIWADANKADGHASQGGGAAVNSPVHNGPITSTNGGTCNGAINAAGQCVGSGTSVQAPLSSGGAVTQPDERTLPRCGDSLGVKGSLSDSSRTLTLTLPAHRGGLADCFGRHLLTTFSTAGLNDAYTLGGGVPRLTMAATNSLPVSFSQQAGVDQKAASIWIRRDFLNAFVGRQSFDLTLSPGASSGAKLKLVMVSDPDYGPKSLAAPYLPTGGRMNSNYTLKVTTYQAAAAGQSFAWNVTSGDVSPVNCFEQTSGTLTPAVGATQLDLGLKVKESSACYGKSFTATVATAGVDQAASTPFQQSLTFSLPRLSTVAAPPPTVTSPVAGATITRP